MPEGVNVVSESNLALVAVVPPTVEEAPTPTAVPAEAPAVAPEVPEEQKEGGEES
jgi:hypothetical protein